MTPGALSPKERAKYDKRPWLYDDDGYGLWVRARWIFIGGALGIVLLLASVFAAAKPYNEAACNQREAELGVAAADYRWLSGTCYLTLDDGTAIPADQYRATEGIER